MFSFFYRNFFFLLPLVLSVMATGHMQAQENNARSYAASLMDGDLKNAVLSVLALTSEGSNLQDVLKNAVLESFDTIEITSANGTATLTSGMIDAGITTKTGAGTLALDGTSASTLSVAEGTLSVGGSPSTISNSLTMAEGTVLAFTQSDALTLGTLDCTRGTVAIDLSGLGYLSLGTHMTLATINELTGWDNLVVQGLDPDFEDGLAWQNTLPFSPHPLL